MSIWVRERGQETSRSISELEFEQIFEVQYCSFLVFCNERVEGEVKSQCAQLKENGQIGPEQEWLGALYRKELSEGFVAELSIEDCGPELGYGLFARADFEPGDFLIEYTGEVCPKPWVVRKPKEYNFSYPSSAYFWHKYVIDSECMGNEARFINHCDDPNIEAVAVWHKGLFRIVMRAIKKISRGTQLAFDYGPKFWRHRAPPKHLFVESD